MSKTEAPHDPDNRPAVGGPVERQVRPLLNWCPCGDADCDTNRTVAKNATVDVKPPVGLRPAWIVEYHNCRDRLIEIAEAMTRYAEAGKPVPLEWCSELERRIENYVPPRRERGPND